MEYGKTTLDDFKTMVSGLSAKETEIFEDGITIINLKTFC